MQKLLLLLFFFLIASYQSFSQTEMPKTNSIDINAKVDKKKERPDEKRHYMTIIKSNTKSMLYGNKCFEDFTRSMGFFYEVQVQGQQTSLSGMSKFWHNFGVKTALLFTKGPFWKIKVNKQKEECRKSSGDFVG